MFNELIFIYKKSLKDHRITFFFLFLFFYLFFKFIHRFETKPDFRRLFLRFRAMFAYSEDKSDSAGMKIGGALLNALIFVGMILVVTIGFVFLYKYRCMKVSSFFIVFFFLIQIHHFFHHFFFQRLFLVGYSFLQLFC